MSSAEQFVRYKNKNVDLHGACAMVWNPTSISKCTTLYSSLEKILQFEIVRGISSSPPDVKTPCQWLTCIYSEHKIRDKQAMWKNLLRGWMLVNVHYHFIFLYKSYFTLVVYYHLLTDYCKVQHGRIAPGNLSLKSCCVRKSSVPRPRCIAAPPNIFSKKETIPRLLETLLFY